MIDEIGKMELFSNGFSTLIRNALDSDKLLFASIALHRRGFIQKIKQRPDIHLLEVTRNNRKQLVAAVLDLILEAYPTT